VDSRNRIRFREMFLERLYLRIGSKNYPCFEEPEKPKDPKKMKLTPAEREQYLKLYDEKMEEYKKVMKIYYEFMELNIDRLIEEIVKMHCGCVSLKFDD
jgi:hypothetical protein